jgi:hypothetical protein
LKKASPDPPTPPSHHHDGLTGSFTCGRPALRRSTEAHRFHERGRTALLEMLVIRLLPCHSLCHRRRAARPPSMQTYPARPMEPDILLRFATWANTLPRIQLLPTLLAPAPLLSHLRPASPPK